MKWLNIVTLLLVIVGGVNWGVIAAGGPEADLVANIFGGATTGGARTIYGLVGLSALWQLVPLFRAMRTSQVDAEGAQARRVEPGR